MKYRNRFIIGLLSAAITFATLTAFIGPARWRHGYHHGCYYERSYHHHSSNQ